MNRRIERLDTIRRYTAEAADNLESVKAAVIRGADWQTPMVNGKVPGLAVTGLRRRALARDLDRAHRAIIGIPALEMEIEAEDEIDHMTRS